MSITRNVLAELVCPNCSGHLDAEGRSLSSSEGVLPEYLSCRTCKTLFPVDAAMVSFVTDLSDQRETASTFGFEWKAFWNGFFDKDDVFGLSFDETAQYFLSSIGLKQEELQGLKILDAGTGSGRIPISLQHTDCSIYAVDIHESFGLVAQRLKNLHRSHFLRADLFCLPFKDQFFDIVWSSGVIHHTPDAAKAFRAIARKVKPGGRLFVSVYGKDLHHYRLLRRLLPFTRRLPVYAVYLLSLVLAAGLYLAFNCALWIVRISNRGRKIPYSFLGFRIENIGYKSYRSILLNLFDQLHPRYQSEHSIDEVESWFALTGFRETVLVESIGMVGIRGTKQG